jgi:hypothetical protein
MHLQAELSEFANLNNHSNLKIRSHWHEKFHRSNNLIFNDEVWYGNIGHLWKASMQMLAGNSMYTYVTTIAAGCPINDPNNLCNCFDFSCHQFEWFIYRTNYSKRNNQFHMTVMTWFTWRNLLTFRLMAFMWACHHVIILHENLMRYIYCFQKE